MSRFSFSLQRLLELKARREQVVAAELANSRAAAEQAREDREELTTLRAANLHARPGRSSGAASIGELRNAEYLLEQLEENLRLAESAVESADARVADRLTAFRGASQERQVLDRMRERQLMLWQADQAKLERIAMDAIALTLHVRREPIEEEERENP